MTTRGGARNRQGTARKLARFHAGGIRARTADFASPTSTGGRARVGWPRVNSGERHAPRAARGLAARQLWLINVGLLTLVGAGYLLHAPEPQSARMGLFLYLGLLSSAASLSIPTGLLTLLATRLVRPSAVLAAFLWTATLLALFLDTQIYGIFRYHFNGMVWNVLTTPGADEAVHIAPLEIGVVVVGALLVFALELLLIARLRRRAAATPLRPRWFGRPAFYWSAVLLPAMLVLTGIYAHADLIRDRQVMSLARLYPVYPRVTIKRLARDWFGYVLEDRPSVAFAADGILLDYPKQEVALPPDGPTPNILIVVVDSLRADMLAPATMPRLSEFADHARVFRDHLSGGNGTRFGIFSLVYALHGSYWKPFYQEQRSPVLVDALLERGYETTVMTSASMSYPEFRSTAWVRVEDTVEERLKGERPGGRDDGVERRFREWLGERGDAERPFFGFLLLDAPHGKYAFPDEFARFTPFAEDVSYLKLASGPSDEDVARVFNRYKNAVLYSDSVVGAILDALEAAGELDDTIVIVTGDHGEEFMENGFVGHTSNFTDAQLHVPFVYFDPALEADEERRPTSHADVAATLLERLGLDPALRASWSLGGNLFDPDPSAPRVASGWDSLGVRVDGAILEVPMKAYGGSIEVYDERWQVRADGDDVLDANGAVLGRLALECRRFLR